MCVCVCVGVCVGGGGEGVEKGAKSHFCPEKGLVRVVGLVTTSVNH